MLPYPGTKPADLRRQLLPVQGLEIAVNHRRLQPFVPSEVEGRFRAHVSTSLDTNG